MMSDVEKSEYYNFNIVVFIIFIHCLVELP